HVQATCRIAHMDLGGDPRVTEPYTEYLLQGRTPRKTEGACQPDGSSIRITKQDPTPGLRAAKPDPAGPMTLRAASDAGALQLVELPGAPVAVVDDHRPVDVMLGRNVSFEVTRYVDGQPTATRTYTDVRGDVRLTTAANGSAQVSVDGQPVAPDATSQPEPQPDPQPEPQPEPQSDPQPEPQPDPEAEPQQDPQPESQPDPQPEPAPQVDPKPASEPQPKPGSEAHTEPKPKPQPASEHAAQSASDTAATVSDAGPDSPAASASQPLARAAGTPLMKISAGGRLRSMLRTGIVVRLSGARPGPLVLRARLGGRVVASGRVWISASGTATVRLRFAPAARRTLARRTQVRLTISAGALRQTVGLRR
ncbi:MAG TPA: hypothetical protein VD836_17060, partial [Solirubrobacteraceae bacterium]|nr:hypothetical protein [Solirubrobacteraceae bacterium]